MPSTIAVSGTSGLIGEALATALSAAGHQVVPIRRDPVPDDGSLAWDGGAGIDTARLRACDAVIHLAGAGIADGRWNSARMQEIRDSRVLGTAAIARALAADAGRVRTLIVASATGFYGDRGEERLDESAPSGSGFLAEVCQAWEAAADPCRSVVRTLHLRSGVVLSAQGGALARMLPPARLGLAGALGGGRQWWAWIALPDLVRAVLFLLETPTLAGPVNLVAPEPVRQLTMAQALAAALGRPALGPPVPRCVLRLTLGRMVDEVLLASARVVPGRLTAGGFHWERPDLAATLADATRR